MAFTVALVVEDLSKKRCISVASQLKHDLISCKLRASMNLKPQTYIEHLTTKILENVISADTTPF